MRIRKNVKCILAVLTLILLFLIFGTPKYQSMKIKSRSFVEVENGIKEAVSISSEVDISKLINFQWDDCYVFHAYYPSEEVYKKVGREWTKCETYLGYLIFHRIENETVNDDQYLVVFKKDNKVILSEIYSLNELPVIFKIEDFKFTRDKGVFTVNSSKGFADGKIKELILKK